MSEDEEGDIYPEVERLMQDKNALIGMLPEEEYCEFLRSAESRPKREYVGAGI